MEHRWGIRQTLDVGVKVYVGSGPPKLGRLRDASSSGAYVTMSAPLPIMTRVRLALEWDDSQHVDRHRIAAYVVRSDAHGIGIEWQEFAALPVLALIDDPFRLPSRGSLDSVRAIMAVREEPAYMPWSRSSGTFSTARNGG